MPASGVRRVCGGLFQPILCLSLIDCLPLHIRWAIQSAALEGDHMVDDVAGAWPFGLLGGRARMLALECCSGGLAALYAPLCVTVDDWRDGLYDCTSYKKDK